MHIDSLRVALFVGLIGLAPVACFEDSGTDGDGEADNGDGDGDATPECQALFDAALECDLEYASDIADYCAEAFAYYSNGAECAGELEDLMACLSEVSCGEISSLTVGSCPSETENVLDACPVELDTSTQEDPDLGTCEPLMAPLPVSIQSTTVGQSNDAEPGTCSLKDDSGSDRAFTYQAPESGNYLIHTIGSQFDTVLSVFDGPCGGNRIVCNDDALGWDPEGSESAVKLELSADQEITIVVDSFGSSGGEFSLAIKRL